MDISAGILLPDTVDSGKALTICCIVEVDRIIHTGVCGRECDSQSCSIDLCEEYHRFRVRLEVLDDVAPVLQFHISIDFSVAEFLLFQHLPDDVYLRSETCEDYQFLSCVYHIIVHDFFQCVQFALADQFRLFLAVCH